MRKAGRNARVGMLVTVLSAGSRGLAANAEYESVERQGTADTMPRIRTDDRDIAQAIAQATEWSGTFRRLVETIQGTDGLVWIQRGSCFRGARACLSLSLVVAGPNRLLRIVVDRQRAGDDLMASLGHELQHAVEVLDSPAKSTTEMFYLYRSPGVYRVGEKFETVAAVEAGHAVGREVTRSRPPRKRPTPAVPPANSGRW